LKNLKALHLVLIGSFGVSLLILILILVLQQIGFNFNLEAIVLVPLLGGISTFSIFYILIKQFIYERLKLVYRSIRKGKFQQDKEFDYSFKRDLIKEAEVETKIWLEERQEEISKLKDQEEFRREFLGNLAHELKTPIFSIQGYLLTLLEGGLEDEKVNREFLERASKATDRMTNLLEDLDTITKLEVNELKTERKPFNINDLIKEIFESFDIN
jgi:two-component system phosphate regulon sensor histidine kinase PhoR